MKEFQGLADDGENRKKCAELRTAYNHLVSEHKNRAKTIDDTKRCFTNAQIAIEKLQSLQQANTPEYLSIRSSALYSLIQTEGYYLKKFKKYCEEKKFTLFPKNEEDFLYFFEELVEKEFKRYITRYDSKRAPLENLFNRTMKKRYPDALEYIRTKARSGDSYLTEGVNEDIRMPSKFNLYEVLIDISKFLTKMYLHGYQKEAAVNGEVQYYQMIFTETVSLVARESKSDYLAYISNEREVFDTMEVAFLDFYTRDICRTFYEIVSSPLKEYREIGIEKNGEIQLEGGLAAKVYHRYFEKLGRTVTENSVNALLSRYKKKYYKILKDLKDLWYDEFDSYANTTVLRKREDGTYIQINYK